MGINSIFTLPLFFINAHMMYFNFLDGLIWINIYEIFNWEFFFSLFFLQIPAILFQLMLNFQYFNSLAIRKNNSLVQEPEIFYEKCQCLVSSEFDDKLRIKLNSLQNFVTTYSSKYIFHVMTHNVQCALSHIMKSTWICSGSWKFLTSIVISITYSSIRTGSLN